MNAFLQSFFYTSGIIFGLGVSNVILHKLLRYPRIPLFNSKKENSKKKKEFLFYYTDGDIKNIEENVKNSFVCPIVDNNIRNPVSNQYGFTFESEAINQWLNSNGTCPMSRKPMSKMDLIPNKNLQNAIKFLVLKEKYNKTNKENKILENEIY